MRSIDLLLINSSLTLSGERACTFFFIFFGSQLFSVISIHSMKGNNVV